MSEHHYVLDAASLVDRCRKKLSSIGERNKRDNIDSLVELDEALKGVGNLIQVHLLELIDQELAALDDNLEEVNVGDGGRPALKDTAEILQSIVGRKQRQRNDHSLQKCHQIIAQKRQSPSRNLSRQDIQPIQKLRAQSMPDLSGYKHSNGRNVEQEAGDSSSSCKAPPSSCYYRTRSAEDSLLFRLIVALQLCLVRIEEAEMILCGRRRRSIDCRARQKGATSALNVSCGEHHTTRTPFAWQAAKAASISVGVAGVGTMLLLGNRAKRDLPSSENDRSTLLRATGKAVAVVISAAVVRRGWRGLCMKARIIASAESIEDWIQQWMSLIHVINGANDCRMANVNSFQSTARASYWHSQGALRFRLIKKGMDILYASIGTAIEVTKQKEQKPSRIWMSAVTAAAASYYSVIGPEDKSEKVVSSPLSSSDVIQNAWGMLSLPQVKRLSLQASRILKGAAIAERISIDGVSCFVLSSDPCPALSTALKRFRRQQKREVSSLSIIHEASADTVFSCRRRAANAGGFLRKNVIFHLTGGGFFAHTIAGDLPYLLDWSATTNAVVICPEYALLPESCFPVALEQVVRVYTSIVSGDASPLLGFQIDRIIVTGESAGGNLGAALCVKLCVDRVVDIGTLTIQKNIEMAREFNFDPYPSNANIRRDCEESLSLRIPTGEALCESGLNQSTIQLPDAIMLCCPALNLGLDTSPSRLVGTADPVLPSGLFSTISDAYLPTYLHIRKSDPLASPYYAPDTILRLFPPTMLYTSTEDPLLDDSVSFNARLRRLGVKSDLKAAHNMPHAYWGLGTAGFPEARQVQVESQEWLKGQFQPNG